MLLKTKKNKECQSRIYLFPTKTFIQIMYVYIVRSSNVNEVIRVVLNSLFFFFTKGFCMHQKYQKHQKHQNHKDTTKQKHKTLQSNSKGMVVLSHQ